MFFTFFLFFLLSFVLSAIFTLAVRNLARRWNILDKPNQARKVHKKPTALLGGAAIFAAFFLVLFLGRENLFLGVLTWQNWIGFLSGGVIIILGGVLDDKHNISALKQLIFPSLAVLAVLLGGIEIEKISNPFYHAQFFSGWEIARSPFFYFDALVVHAGILNISIISAIFVFTWLFGMMYTTKLLDGLDGLVAGMAGIGSAIIFLFTMSERFYQPDIAFASLILAGACLGFLIFNWQPASIFLGEGGSLFLGYALGVLAIISGGKVAIALLIMGVPIIDAGWTIIRRLMAKKNPLKAADREHLHHKLLDLGLSIKQTVLVFYAGALVFGLGALLLQSVGKILLLIVLFCLMIGVLSGLRKILSS